MFNLEKANTSFIIFGLIWSGIESTIYHIRFEHAYNYITESFVSKNLKVIVYIIILHFPIIYYIQYSCIYKGIKVQSRPWLYGSLSLTCDRSVVRIDLWLSELTLSMFNSPLIFRTDWNVLLLTLIVIRTDRKVLFLFDLYIDIH